jgi:hypothetical protein
VFDLAMSTTTIAAQVVREAGEAGGPARNERVEPGGIGGGGGGGDGRSGGSGSGSGGGGGGGK